METNLKASEGLYFESDLGADDLLSNLFAAEEWNFSMQLRFENFNLNSAVEVGLAFVRWIIWVDTKPNNTQKTKTQRYQRLSALTKVTALAYHKFLHLLIKVAPDYRSDFSFKILKLLSRLQPQSLDQHPASNLYHKLTFKSTTTE